MFTLLDRQLFWGKKCGGGGGGFLFPLGRIKYFYLIFSPKETYVSGIIMSVCHLFLLND
jgi:hypothetical protein